MDPDGLDVWVIEVEVDIFGFWLRADGFKEEAEGGIFDVGRDGPVGIEFLGKIFSKRFEDGVEGGGGV